MKLFYKRVVQMLVFMCISVTTFAQTQINGRVTNSTDGAALSGVSVGVKNTRTTTKTAADGSFSISVPASTSVLVFTSVGYASQEVAASSGMSVTLVRTTAQLQDVVVVAYGTRRKTDLTGSVVAVGQKDFQKGNINSSEQLLQGKVAGLEITTGGGYAGGGSKIRIRSGASLNASNEPLIVIDGVPVESNGLSGSANYLNTINPNDIESISVLKDASATALYGSRASNGVLIITTKKGTTRKPVFNFNTKYSQSRVEDYIDVLSATEVRNIVTGIGNPNFVSKLGTANTDWQKTIYQNANGYDNNLSVSGVAGGSSDIKLPYRASIGYLNQEGVVRTNKFDRMTASLNLNPKFLEDHLSVNFAFKYANTKTRFVNDGAVGNAVSFDPTHPVYSGAKNWGGYYETLQADGKPFDLSPRNPLALLELQKNVGYVDRIISNVQIDYKFHFLPDLHLMANLGLDNASGFGTTSVDSNAATNYQKLGYFSEYKQKKYNYLADVSLFYSKDIASLKSKFDVLVGHTYQDFYTNQYNYAAYNKAAVLDSTTIPAYATDKPEYRIESYLGRLNYTFNDKYLLTASIRRDATSKFSSDNRVGYFPAVALAWKLKNDFFRNVKAITELKLRGGYGETGQQDGIGNYSYLASYYQSASTAQYQLGNTFYTFLRPGAYDANLKWETTATTNIGLDFGLFNNRISGSVEVYEKKTKNLLSTVPVAPGANFDISLLTNVGNIKNRGIEASLNLTPVRTKNFTWDLNVNGSYNEIKITNLLVNQDPTFKGIPVNGIAGGTGNNISKHFVGEAPYTFFVYKQVYDAAGKPIEGLYEDLNRDGVINDLDKRFFKKPTPDFLFGFSTQVNIYKFYVGMAAHGMAGNYLYNNYNSNSGNLNTIQNTLGFLANASANYLDTKFVSQQLFSDYYIENASFLKIDNINVGYNFGKISNGRAALRLNASVQNVHTFTKYSGADPENSGNGVDNNIYPRPRTYSVGASLDF